MLYRSAISSEAFSLLKRIMAIDELQEFNLAGGTALPMQLGHRISYDLDFFGFSRMSIEEVPELLPNEHQYQEMHRSKNILVLNINGIKVDFVKYKYPLLGPLREEAGIRLLSVEDIAAMKLDAIKGRGRRRDFYDLYFLLKQYGLKEMLDLHQRKYQQDTQFLILKSMVYFDDAESDPPVQLLSEKISWDDVKETIKRCLTDLD